MGGRSPRPFIFMGILYVVVFDMFAGGAVADNTQQEVYNTERHEHPPDDNDIGIIEEFDKSQPGHEESQRRADIGQKGPFVGLLGSNFGQFFLVFARIIVPVYVNILRHVITSKGYIRRQSTAPLRGNQQTRFMGVV